MKFLSTSGVARATGLAAALLIASAAAVRHEPAVQAQAIAASPEGLTLERAMALVDARARKVDYLPGEVLIRFKKGVNVFGQQRALSALRSRPPVSTLRWMGQIAHLKDPSQPDSVALARQLADQPEVLYAEPNYLYRLPVTPKSSSRPAAVSLPRPLLIPNDPDFNLQWNFAANVLNMPAAWEINNGGSDDVIVAIVDTGFTVNAQTLNLPIPTGTSIVNANIPFAPSPQLPIGRVVTPFDFANTGTANVIDFDGHGTHVTSTVAELTNNGAGVAGIAFNVRIMPVKVCVGYWEVAIALAQGGQEERPPTDVDGCTNSDIIQGVQFASERGARVINISLGGGGQSFALRDAISNAVAQGAFVSIAMGNEFQSGDPVQFPAQFAANINGAMAVAAINRNRSRAGYSSTGSHCEIAAPGGDTAVGGVAGRVFQTTINQVDVSPFIPIPRFDRYAVQGFEGTSMATPHVSGVAALVISQNQDLTPAAVETLLRGTAEDLGSAGRDNQFGFGLVQPFRALRGRGIGVR